MKQVLLILMVLIATNFSLHSQTETQATILYDGLYIAKTGEVPAANIEIYTYLKFYEDGSVYLQAVSSNDPQAVSKWFGRDKKFSERGTYKIEGSTILIQLSNKDSEDFKLEGSVETTFKGTIKQDTQICLTRNKETEEKCFMFSKTP